MDEMLCYVCKEPLRDHDLIIPINVHLKLPFGYTSIAIYQHYLCGLKHYLENVTKSEDISDKDRMEIETELMTALTNMKRGTTQ